MLMIHQESHLDHGLSEAAVCYLLDRFADRDGFFIETVELPDFFPPVVSALYGPAAGDAPVSEVDVFYTQRGGRRWSSRMVRRPSRPTRTVTLIAGPYDGQSCVLYTIYGGPLAPQEPGDPACKDVVASREFWQQHALASE